MRQLVVVLTGPESTGKTTLAEHLAERFGAPWSPEGARVWFEERLAEDASAALSYETVTPIAERQIALEEQALAEAMRRGARLVLRDTDLVSTVAYSRVLYGRAPAWVEAAARARRGDRYLLCDVDAPWVEDHVRGEVGNRFAVRDVFEATLAEMGCDVTVLRGEWATRLRDAEAAVSRWLAARQDQEKQGG